MNTHYDISVLITYHEEGALLSECIESILSQDYLNLEIIIYDDCSEENPAALFISNPEIKIITGSKNKGPGSARNCLLAASSASYIHFHDADDLFAPEWCARISSALSKKPDIVLCDVLSFCSTGTVCDSVLNIGPFHENLPDYLSMALNGSILVPSTVIKRELVQQLGGYLERNILPQSEDSDFHIRLSMLVNSFEFIQEPLIYQRLRSNSHSSLAIVSCWQSAIACIPHYLSIFPASVHPLIAQRASRIASNLYALDDKKNAAIGFKLADTFGASYEHRSLMFRVLAKTCGQSIAEFAGAIYITLKLLPKNLVRRLTPLPTQERC